MTCGLIAAAVVFMGQSAFAVLDPVTVCIALGTVVPVSYTHLFKKLFRTLFTILGAILGYGAFELLHFWMVKSGAVAAGEFSQWQQIVIGLIFAIIFGLIFFRLTPVIRRQSVKVADLSLIHIYGADTLYDAVGRQIDKSLQLIVDAQDENIHR